MSAVTRGRACSNALAPETLLFEGHHRATRSAPHFFDNRMVPTGGCPCPFWSTRSRSRSPLTAGRWSSSALDRPPAGGAAQ